MKENVCRSSDRTKTRTKQKRHGVLGAGDILDIFVDQTPFFFPSNFLEAAVHLLMGIVIRVSIGASEE